MVPWLPEGDRRALPSGAVSGSSAGVSEFTVLTSMFLLLSVYMAGNEKNVRGKIYLLGSLCGSLRVRVFVFLGGEKEKVR